MRHLTVFVEMDLLILKELTGEKLAKSAGFFLFAFSLILQEPGERRGQVNSGAIVTSVDHEISMRRKAVIIGKLGQNREQGIGIRE